MNEVFKFHNNLKRKYINKYAGTNLLDLASGRGGDLLKWRDNPKIKNVVGFDINEKSVKEAKRRYVTIKIKKGLKAVFYVKDLGKDSVSDIGTFDIITCNFAFHYFFKSPKTLETILQTISSSSKKGTIFIATLFDGNLVPNTIKFDNFEIKRINPKSKANYGNEISVYIKDSVLSVPEIEYLVKPSFLVSKLKSINFELAETSSFDNFFNKSFNLSDEEKIFSALNRVYVFRKK
jgi:mRNA (guanine-N7-)-methyltransferase